MPEFKQVPGPLLLCFKIITVDYKSIIAKRWGRTYSSENVELRVYRCAAVGNEGLWHWISKQSSSTWQQPYSPPPLSPFLSKRANITFLIWFLQEVDIIQGTWFLSSISGTLKGLLWPLVLFYVHHSLLNYNTYISFYKYLHSIYVQYIF